jgi:adenylate cyclase
MTDTAMPNTNDNPHREIWYTIFAIGHPDLTKYQHFNMRLPSPPRCKLCYAPFRGIGSLIMKFQGRLPSNKNPRYCSRCDQFMRKFPGGAEVESTVLFIDVRGSTKLADQMPPMEFSRLMHQFYAKTFPLIYGTDGFILDVRGDGLLAIYPPGFSGPDHARKALDAVEALLRMKITGPNSTPISFGIGVHTGTGYIGTMTGADSGVEDVTVLGDVVNVAAKLCAAAQSGEAIVSEVAYRAADSDMASHERRNLVVRGKNEPIEVLVYKATDTAGA